MSIANSGASTTRLRLVQKVVEEIVLDQYRNESRHQAAPAAPATDHRGNPAGGDQERSLRFARQWSEGN